MGGERSGSQKTCPNVSTVTVPSGKGPLVVSLNLLLHATDFVRALRRLYFAGAIQKAERIPLTFLGRSVS